MSAYGVQRTLGCPRRQHGLGNLLKDCVTANELADARLEGLMVTLPTFSP
jgi:hypothetical protein